MASKSDGALGELGKTDGSAGDGLMFSPYLCCLFINGLRVYDWYIYTRTIVYVPVEAQLGIECPLVFQKQYLQDE